MPTSILKDTAETFAPLIMRIVNASLQSGTVPADVKQALVTPLHKCCYPLFTHFGVAVRGKATLEMLALVIPYSDNTIR